MRVHPSEGGGGGMRWDFGGGGEWQGRDKASFIACVRRRQGHPTPVLLPGKSHGRRTLVGCSPRGHKVLATTERLHFHVSLSCIGEGNGNPLQCSCLENPRDGGAWWAVVYGVAQSRRRLKRLSSSSSSSMYVKVYILGTMENLCTILAKQMICDSFHF